MRQGVRGAGWRLCRRQFMHMARWECRVSKHTINTNRCEALYHSRYGQDVVPLINTKRASIMGEDTNEPLGSAYQ